MNRRKTFLSSFKVEGPAYYLARCYRDGRTVEKFVVVNSLLMASYMDDVSLHESSVVRGSGLNVIKPAR